MVNMVELPRYLQDSAAPPRSRKALQPKGLSVRSMLPRNQLTYLVLLVGFLVGEFRQEGSTVNPSGRGET